MGMWRLKSCLRCGGDIYIERIMGGWKEQCLQCSFFWECDMRPELVKEAKIASERITVDSETVFDVPCHDSYFSSKCYGKRGSQQS